MSFYKITRALVVSTTLFFASHTSLHAQQSVTISEGTEVKIRLLETLSSNNAVVGQKFNLELEQDLQLNNQTVFPKGTKALGSVVSARKKGFMGKAGELNIKIDYLLFGDQRIALRSTTASEGKSKVGTTVALTVLFGPIGLLKRGKDIELETGTVFTAFIDQTVQVPMAFAAPQIMAPSDSAPRIVVPAQAPVAEADAKN